MNATDQCLERQQIQRFLTGDCADEQAESIAEHLGRCAVCGALATEIVGQSGTIVRLARSFDDRIELEPACKELRRRLLGHPPTLLAQLALPLALGQYDLLEPIGQGGMGRVFKARQRLLKRSVAVKLLSPDRADDPDAVASFLHEMEAIGSLDHPHIVRAADAACLDGVYFLVMDYVPGLDVARLLDQLRQLACADACEVVRQAAVGLQYAHENGLVHCDIKPSNLLLTEQGVVKLLDLGLARFQQRESPNSSTVAGTVDYMAPEQWSLQFAIDIRADIYALGCTLFKLLTGKAPYEDAEGGRRSGHESAPIPSLTALRSDVPPELEAIVRRMLAKQREDRFARPRDVAEAIAPFCEQSNLKALIRQVVVPTGDTVRLSVTETIAGRQRLERLRNIGKQRIRLILIGVALALALAGSVVFSLLSGNRNTSVWQVVSLAEPHSFVSRDVEALVTSRKLADRPVLEATTRSPLFIPMGSATAPPFSLRTSIGADFTGETGIYFGHLHLLSERSIPHQYRVVTVVRDASQAPGEVWIRHANFIESNSITVHQEHEQGQWTVRMDGTRKFQTLEVDVFADRLQIKWNDAIITNGPVDVVPTKMPPWPVGGAFGLFVNRGTVVFEEFKMNTSESEKRQ